MIESPELIAGRDYRRRQAKERGIVAAARALHFASEAEILEWMPSVQGPGMEMAVQTIRRHSPTIRVFDGIIDEGVFAKHVALPEGNLVLEVEIAAVDREDRDVVSAYVPGEWETRFFTFVSEIVLARRLTDRMRAIAVELKNRDALNSEMRRWDV